MNYVLRSLNFLSIAIFILLLFFLAFIAVDGFLTPAVLFLLMITFGSLLIVFFSNKDEIILKVKLFIFFFSLYLLYALLQHYLLLHISPTLKPFIYFDEDTFLKFSNIAVPYVFGDKNFSELFTNYKLGLFELPLHVIITTYSAYLSILIDGMNTIVVQKLLAPFFGAMLIVVLYATLKHQFLDRTFALKSTFVYGICSAVFVYATPMLRDIDIALTYMIVIYLFLQPNSYKNFFLLLLVSYATIYLRFESGLILFAITLLYAYLHIRTIESKSLKYIFYLLIVILFSFVILLMYNKILGMIVSRGEVDLARSTQQASKDSIGMLLNKLPFGIKHIAKVSFGQIQPFPFTKAANFRAAISGVFWPFIVVVMFVSIMNVNIRTFITTKIKYLLLVAIATILLMSSEPMPRRMMSVYPIIYIASLYVFFHFESYKIKKIFSYYLFAIIALTVFYFLLKIR